jgi:hypothetical protein
MNNSWLRFAFCLLFFAGDFRSFVAGVAGKIGANLYLYQAMFFIIVHFGL